MCRLFGLYANRLVDVYFSFYGSLVRSLKELSYINSSGWGVAWSDEKGWHIYKEPWTLYSSTKAEELVKKNAR